MVHGRLYQPYLMKGIYKYASLVEEATEDASYSYFYEIDWNNKAVAKSIVKPSKESILHYYIYSLISVEQTRDYRKNSDLYCETQIAEIEYLFDAYDITYRNFDEFWKQYKSKKKEEREIFPWFESQEEQFRTLWTIITDEVHRLLFANRSFLLTFNLGFAEYIKENVNIIPLDDLTKKNKIKRSTIPKWVKNAVFFRDHGRCVFCSKDLTGLLSTDINLHFDHIVPLNQFGSNDPSNFQLSCAECNIKKSGVEGSTDINYPSWWD